MNKESNKIWIGIVVLLIACLVMGGYSLREKSNHAIEINNLQNKLDILKITTDSQILNLQNKNTNLSTELNSVPCWNKVCCVKQVLPGNTAVASGKGVYCKYKSEFIMTSKMFLAEEDILTVNDYRKIFDPLVKITFDQRTYPGERMGLVEWQIIDNRGNLIYETNEGTRPSWLTDDAINNAN